jgi:hypothetical protein
MRLKERYCPGRKQVAAGDEGDRTAAKLARRSPAEMARSDGVDRASGAEIQRVVKTKPCLHVSSATLAST